MRKTILLFALLLSGLSSFAGTDIMTFRNLTTSNGLSNGGVLCFCQDHEGYVWIGTADGLNRYDGIGFTVFKNIGNDTTSLTSNYINCIYEDKQNNLWIGSNNGLLRYNRDLNNFERIPMVDDCDTLFDKTVSVTQIFEDNNNQLWIGSHLGIYLFNKDNYRFTKCFVDSSVNYAYQDCNCICQDRKGNLWFSFLYAENVGVLEYNQEKNTLTHYSTNDQAHNLKENRVSSLMINDNDDIWIGYYSKGIDILDQQTGKISTFSTISNSIYSMTHDTEGKIIVATDGAGILIVDPLKKTIGQQIASSSQSSLVSNNVRTINISREGIVWIGSWGGGISMYDKRINRFKIFKQENSFLDSNPVTCFAEDAHGNIWIATDGGGIHSFNPRSGALKTYRSDSKNPETLTNNKVLFLCTDSKGGLWAGLWQGGLNYFIIDGDKLVLKKKYNSVDENNPISNSIFNIYQTKEDQLWVGTFLTGAYLFDQSAQKFNPVSLSSEKKEYNTIRDIFCDSYNNLWVSSEQYGLVMIDGKSGKSTIFLHNNMDSTSLSNGSINVIFEDSKHRLWFGGDESGLNLFNRNDKTFTHYTTDQGLPHNSVQGILEDSHGNLWISSMSGISKVTIDTLNAADGIPTLTFRNYTDKDGLQSRDFNRWAYLKSSTGEMYFGGSKGFNVFQPDSIKDNTEIPPVYLTDFLLFNKPVTIGKKGSPLKKHISQTKELVLHHNQTVLTFRFIALNYIFSEKNQYAYKLEGFEDEWNYMGNKNEATYTNLDPGTYTLRVKASNNDGVWNEKGASLKITILPPWWQTWWFRALMVFFVLAFIYLYIFMKMRSYLKIQKQLSEQVKQRTLELEKANTLLIEKNSHIEKQAQELKLSNDDLQTRQLQIEKQAEELKLKNEQLDELNKSKDKLFSIIAHDLKNPFCVIMGLSSVLMDKNIKTTPKEKEELVENIHSSTEKVFKLLENLLVWSRSQLRRISIAPVSYNLTDQICEVVVQLEGMLAAKNVNLIFEEEKDILVFADRQMIETVLRNLISNAIKFSNENKSITIELAETEGNAVCSIIDQGIGMSEKQVSDLFKIDKMMSTEGTKGETGTGLGLNLCLDFLEKNGGSIWVKSFPGEGSTFYFSLPTKK